MKIGIGYDVHKLVANRKLIIGGVEIPYNLGLLGHSDADVLSHAIADAVLGAAKLGDIGKHFPDTDPKFKDANSLDLLSEVANMLKNEKLKIVDIDSIVICQAPKLSPYRDSMINNIAKALKIDSDCIGIKATTSEGLGFEGMGEGISAQAVALLQEDSC